MNLTKKLINEPKNAVTEYLEGYVSSVEHVQLLEGAPEVSRFVFSRSAARLLTLHLVETKSSVCMCRSML